MAFAIFKTLMILLNVAKWIIIIQAVVSWLVAFNIINMGSDFVRTVLTGLERMTEPLYRPIRKVMPDLGALDLSPMVVLLTILILQQAILPAIFAPLM